MGQSTSSNGSPRNIMDHSAPRINNKQGKSTLVGGRGEKQERSNAPATKEEPLQQDKELNSTRELRNTSSYIFGALVLLGVHVHRTSGLNTTVMLKHFSEPRAPTNIVLVHIYSSGKA